MRFHMKIENEWLDSEISTLRLETKQKKRRKMSDNLMAFKLFLMITAVFFYAPLIEAGISPVMKKLILIQKTNSQKNHVLAKGEGRNFICPKCRMCQWQDDKNADWAGNFTCSSCGANLGK